MNKGTIIRLARTMFLSCLICGLTHQALYSQTTSVSDKTVHDQFYSSAGKWMKASNKDCLVWSSFPRNGESVTWSGDVTNGKAHGTGVVQWFTNGIPTTSYEGEMKNGLSDGHGIARGSKDDPTFEGDSEKGYLVSKTMTCQYKNGGWYKGEQKNGLKDGRGEEMMPGGKYIGQFKRDRFDGKGEMILTDGGKITGEWADSKLVGVGIYATKDGQVIKVKMTEKGIVNAE